MPFWYPGIRLRSSPHTGWMAASIIHPQGNDNCFYSKRKKKRKGFSMTWCSIPGLFLSSETEHTVLALGDRAYYLSQESTWHRWGLNGAGAQGRKGRQDKRWVMINERVVGLGGCEQVRWPCAGSVAVCAAQVAGKPCQPKLLKKGGVLLCKHRTLLCTL